MLDDDVFYEIYYKDEWSGPHCLDQKNAFLSYRLDPSSVLIP
jgi:hypothetical protein